MEAYNFSGLKNRLVSGDYENFALNAGKNTVSVSGNVDRIDIKNFSRWI